MQKWKWRWRMFLNEKLPAHWVPSKQIAKGSSFPKKEKEEEGKTFICFKPSSWGITKAPSLSNSFTQSFFSKCKERSNFCFPYYSWLYYRHPTGTGDEKRARKVRRARGTALSFISKTLKDFEVDRLWPSFYLSNPKTIRALCGRKFYFCGTFYYTNFLTQPKAHLFCFVLVVKSYIFTHSSR